MIALAPLAYVALTAALAAPLNLAITRLPRRPPPPPGRLRARQAIVAVAFPLLCAGFWRHDGPGLALVAHTAVVAFFVAIAAIDLEHRLVLNWMTGPGLLAALALAAAGLGPALGSAAAGALLGFLVFFGAALLLPGLGMGDVKL